VFRNLLQCIASLILLFCYCPMALAQSTYIAHFGTREGLPSNNCYFTLQDSKGYIWVASDAGVSRFDGKTFKNFSVDDGLPDNQVLQVKEDKIGRIWFLTLNGKLSYFYNGRLYNEGNSNLLKLLKFNDIIVSFYEDSQGRIWLGSNNNRLYVWDGKYLIKYVSKNHNKQFIQTFIHEDRFGAIWAISQQATMVFKDSKFYSTPKQIAALSDKTIANLPGDRLIYLDKQGLAIQTNNHKTQRFKLGQNFLNASQGYIYANDLELWLSNNDGIFQLERSGQIHQYLKGIPSSQVIKDRDHNMWFTTTDGIYMLPKKENRMYVIDKNSGLVSDNVRSITRDEKNRLWLGLDNASINVLDTKTLKVEKITFPDKKRYWNVKQLFADKDSVYFASDNGLGRITGTPAKPQMQYLKESNNGVFAVKDFSVGKNKDLAIATSSGIIQLNVQLKNFEFNAHNLSRGKTFYNNRAYSVAYDHHGTLWFSNTEGLNHVDQGKLQSPSAVNKLLKQRINDIKAFADGTLVLATDGYGLIFLKDGKIVKRITMNEGLADNICKKLFLLENHAWVVTNNGVNRVCLDGKHPEVEGFEYTVPLLKNDVNDLYIGKDTAYFATSNGLVYFFKKQFNALREAPDVLISSITNNKAILNVDSALINLDPSANNITFYYGAIDFVNQNIGYRYRLNPEDNWTETKSRRLEFSSLSPGSYRFEVSAKSNNTKWSAPAQIHFVIAEHFWQTYWFIVILVVAASFSFYKIAVIITRWQKNQEQKQLLLKHKILILEQRALQAMMNPHFIFNVMNSIQHYINTQDTSSANKILTGFAKLIRKNLEICTKSFISIEEELEYLNLYLVLEKKRFGSKFNYTIVIDPAIENEEIYIPSMLLQPYIENAIWHGLMPKEEGGNLRIEMSLEKEEHTLLIHIMDDGVGIDNSLRTKDGTHLSKGMSLTEERINLLNQIESSNIEIAIKQNGVSGTVVEIRIPNA
jgi:sensor histidine kinase YesM/ligand-binding sensor domain-containing protein